MKARIVTLAVASLLAVAGSASAATLTGHVLCGSSCGTLAATKGAGTLRLTATGTSYGSVASGQIAIKDLSNNGARDFSVSGWSRSWSKDGFTFYSGNNLSYFVSTTWTIKIYGNSGVTSSSTAKGYGYIKGSGKWDRNSHGARDWPSLGTSFQLSSSS